MGLSKALGTHMGELPEFEFEILEDSVEAYSLGAVGWGAAVFRFTVEGLDPVVVRNTSVFVLEDGVWKAIQVHNSAPRANEDARCHHDQDARRASWSDWRVW